jgi:hypothetical protein
MWQEDDEAWEVEDDEEEEEDDDDFTITFQLLC